MDASRFATLNISSARGYSPSVPAASAYMGSPPLATKTPMPGGSPQKVVSPQRGGSLRDYQMARQHAEAAAERAEFARTHREQCAVCQEPFGGGVNTPKIAPCLHTICQQCIETLPGQVCPLDRTPIVEKTVMSLAPPPTNWIALGSVDMVNMQQGKTRYCDLCDEESAESVSVEHCSTCNHHLCSIHASAHRRTRDTKHHELRTFSHYVASLQQQHPSGENSQKSGSYDTYLSFVDS
jgi:hypothetical protein